ncbi:MAG: NUDIX hydrolase [Bauldia sp.]
MTARTRQYGALAFRRGADGRIEVALVTSRERGRWIIPKGWPRPAEAHLTVAREALEEAGLVGTVSSESLGIYRYDKIRTDGAAVECEVDVHLLAVEQELEDWPERPHRQRRWVRPEALADELDEANLAELLRSTDWVGAIQRMTTPEPSDAERA